MILSKRGQIIQTQTYRPSTIWLTQKSKLRVKILYNIQARLVDIIMQLTNPKPLPLEDFLASITTFSVQEKYYKWENYLQTMKHAESPFYQATLEKFVEYYPFNHSYWSQIVQLALKVPKTGKANAVRLYQLALAQNPRSITLWKNYLSWLQKEICKSDPGYLKKEHDKAIKIIGNHFKAGFIFEAAFNLEPSPAAKYLILKRGLVSPLKDIDLIYDLAASWLDSPDLPLSGLVAIAQQEGVTAENEADLRQQLKSALRRFYEPSKKHVEQRQLWQQKVGELDEYAPNSGKIESWRGYISWMRGCGNPDFVGPLYERALITNCDNQSLWQEYFLLLENESNFARALYILRSHSVFFRSLSKELTYYWVELQERDSHIRSREIYLQLQRTEPNLQVFMRHIQMEIRYKQYLNACVLYETLLTTFTSNPDILVIILLQYAELTLKYFRDIDIKKVLRSYFDAYPFHEGLFFALLRHYKQHVQLKENTRQSKLIVDQFIEIVVDGLRRALEVLPHRYSHISKLARKILREYVGSIFLVKTAERKIKEMEMQERRKGERNKSLKRARENQGQTD